MTIEYADQLTIHYNELWCSDTVATEYISGVGDKPSRFDLVKKYSWAIPNEEALGKLAEIQPLVEIGAGTGYWAYELRRRNVEIHAYDQFPPDGSDWTSADEEQARTDEDAVRKNWYHRGHTAWTSVLQGTPDVLRTYDPEFNLFLCWPPMTEMAAYALGYHRGKYIAYIGESESGCTGDKMFFRLLKKLYREVETVNIPQWPGLHDYLTIYERWGR